MAKTKTKTNGKTQSIDDVIGLLTDKEAALLLKLRTFPDSTGFINTKEEGALVPSLKSKNLLETRGRIGTNVRYRVRYDLINIDHWKLIKEIANVTRY